jgi:hypothetical protein
LGGDLAHLFGSVGYAKEQLRADVAALMESACRAAARSVNAVMTATYWSVGRRTVEFEQGGLRTGRRCSNVYRAT